ncbi:MAG: hypothetical protein ACK59G_08595 [Cyanobacteriota bacterium]
MVCLDIGNASNGRTAELLISGQPLIEGLIDHPEAGFLVLGSRGSGRAF